MVINTPTGSGARSDGYEIRSAATRRGIPVHHDDDRRLGRGAGDRRPGQRRRRACRSLQELHGSATRLASSGVGRARARVAVADRDRAAGARALRAPRALREVVANEVSGRLPDRLRGRSRAGRCRAAGQFYMLTGERGWGGGGERPFLPRAFSVADAVAGAEGVRLSFLLEDVGPGTHELARLERGDGLLLTGPLGRPFSMPRELNPDAAGAILVGGGIGLAPLALWRRTLAERGHPRALAARIPRPAHSGGLELFRCSEVRLASARTATPATAATSPTCSP